MARGIKVYDPFVHENIVESQYQDFDEFLQAVDLVVIMVGHRQIIENMESLSDKTVLDTRNVCQLANVYKL